ncbi:flagellar basal body-associated protein FliL [Aliidiomarina minuta]|uniref:Flagellar protein FliL n=1 Tax=Aliidiomarina minuta TaxID=880057 RepID=A0A432W9R1_9GAMM|nr:flagellar basal body-associated protein FliL [Aliidiomarina minuta]RUO26775.1 flagellar basal body-associated protein FliL [Aliidiomarina minuta]
MRKYVKGALITVMLWILTASVHAQSEQRQVYFAFEPDITTNFVKLDDTRHLGYVRISVQAVVGSVNDLQLLEHHAPLLRDAFIEIFGEAQEGKVRSLTGRDEIRRDCLSRAQELMEQETGREVIENLIFTNYLYQ